LGFYHPKIGANPSKKKKTYRSRPTAAPASWVCNPHLLASLLFFSSFSSFSFLPYLDENQVSEGLGFFFLQFFFFM
jgi:hypothetical protein